MNKGLLLVLSAPSGAGKGTIIKRLMDDDRSLKLSVSATTRSPRPGEVDGEDYFFLSRDEFDGLVKRGEMLEHAEYVGNCYGTPKGPVESWLQDGQDVILEIDVQGGAQVKQIMPECVSIFILPPSMRKIIELSSLFFIYFAIKDRNFLASACVKIGASLMISKNSSSIMGSFPTIR